MDLGGPKIRLGKMDREIEIEAGESIVISSEPDGYTGKLKMIPTDFIQLSNDVKTGDRILIDDGLLQVVFRAAGGGVEDDGFGHSSAQGHGEIRMDEVLDRQSG